MNAISHHYYTLPTGDWGKHGSALGFGEDEWFSTMRNTLRIEEFIQNNIAIMDKFDPEKKVGFYVDEWGTWYDVAEGENPGFLFQQNSLRDAVLAGVNLNVFHNYAERVQMSNIAQMVNVLQAMILTDKEKMLLTPTYHAFKMYIPFQDATSFPVKISGPNSYHFGEESIPAISASAGKDKKGKLWLALVNTNPNSASTLNIVGAQQWKAAKGKILTATTMDAHNTFDAPNNVEPQKFVAKAKGGKLQLSLPPKSVLVVELSQ